MFIDIEKVYDKVPCEVLCKCLEKKKVPMMYIQAIRIRMRE